jgi:hypothetical protein
MIGRGPEPRRRGGVVISATPEWQGKPDGNDGISPYTVDLCGPLHGG